MGETFFEPAPVRRKVPVWVWLLVAFSLSCCCFAGLGFVWTTQSTVSTAAQASPAVDSLFSAVNDKDAELFYKYCAKEFKDEISLERAQEKMEEVHEQFGSVSKGITTNISIRSDSEGSFMKLSIRVRGAKKAGVLTLYLKKSANDWGIYNFHFS
mgnify:FL=1